MKKPYIKFYKTIDGLDFYIVDGDWIRDNWDDQLVNVNLHERFHFVPVREAWLDKQIHPSEYRYLVANALAQKEALNNGCDIWAAMSKGDEVEQRLRDTRKMGNVKIRKLDEYANITIWLVKGEEVAKKDASFTQGGHDLVYSFIKPKKGQGEIWMDDRYEGVDRENDQLHEMRERNERALGMPYGHSNRVTGAHASASFEEKEARRNPELLKSLVEKEKEIARIIYEEGTGESARKHIKDLTQSWNRAIKFDICRKYRRPKYTKRLSRHVSESISQLK
jgi:hypothetical protein